MPGRLRYDEVRTLDVKDGQITGGKLALNTVQSPYIHETVIKSEVVTLTNAQIKALRATPATLVAAPDAGKVLQFLGMTMFLDYGSNALTESSDDMAVKYENGSGTTVSETITGSGFITATADSMRKVEPASSAVIAKTACDGKALVLHNTGDGEYAGNAGADTVIRCRVIYRVITAGW